MPSKHLFVQTGLFSNKNQQIIKIRKFNHCRYTIICNCFLTLQPEFVYYYELV
jgi:hypothetical protein